MTEAEFRALAAQGYNRIPLVLESFADLDTPLSLYVKLANEDYTFLLESVVGGERFGRYSFIGLPAKIRIRARGTAIEVDDDGAIVERHDGDPLAFVGEFLRRYRAAPRPGLPRFCGGLAGYFGYDAVRHIETRLAGRSPSPGPGLADVPDILLLLTEELAVVDNLAGKISLIVYADPGEPGCLRQGARTPAARCGASCASRYRSRSRRRPCPRRPGANLAPRDSKARGAARQGLHRRRRRHAGRAFAADAAARSQRRRCRSIARCARSIHRRTCSTTISAISTWSAPRPRSWCARKVRRSRCDRSPARARAARRAKPTNALAQELLADPKEIAEHVMLLDLGRNDVGRVAQTGTVRVTDRMVVERYSHVMHIVSNVEGVLQARGSPASTCCARLFLPAP